MDGPVRLLVDLFEIWRSFGHEDLFTSLMHFLLFAWMKYYCVVALPSLYFEGAVSLFRVGQSNKGRRVTDG